MAKKKAAAVEEIVRPDPCPDCDGTGLYNGLEPSVFTPYCSSCEGTGLVGGKEAASELAQAEEEQKASDVTDEGEDEEEQA